MFSPSRLYLHRHATPKPISCLSNAPLARLPWFTLVISSRRSAIHRRASPSLEDFRRQSISCTPSRLANPKCRTAGKENQKKPIALWESAVVHEIRRSRSAWKTSAHQTRSDRKRKRHEREGKKGRDPEGKKEGRASIFVSSLYVPSHLLLNYPSIRPTKQTRSRTLPSPPRPLVRISRAHLSFSRLERKREGLSGEKSDRQKVRQVATAEETSVRAPVRVAQTRSCEARVVRASCRRQKADGEEKAWCNRRPSKTVSSHTRRRGRTDLALLPIFVPELRALDRPLGKAESPVCGAQTSLAREARTACVYTHTSTHTREPGELLRPRDSAAQLAFAAVISHAGEGVSVGAGL